MKDPLTTQAMPYLRDIARAVGTERVFTGMDEIELSWTGPDGQRKIMQVDGGKLILVGCHLYMNPGTI